MRPESGRWGELRLRHPEHRNICRSFISKTPSGSESKKLLDSFEHDFADVATAVATRAGYPTARLAVAGALAGKGYCVSSYKGLVHYRLFYIHTRPSRRVYAEAGRLPPRMTKFISARGARSDA